MYHIALLIGAAFLITCVTTKKTGLAVAVAIVTITFMIAYECVHKEKASTVTELTVSVSKVKEEGKAWIM